MVGESRRERHAEEKRLAEESGLESVVRRTCRQCSNQWVLPASLIEAARGSGEAGAFGDPAMAFDTCRRCGSIRYFDETPLV